MMRLTTSLTRGARTGLRFRSRSLSGPATPGRAWARCRGTSFSQSRASLGSAGLWRFHRRLPPARPPADPSDPCRGEHMIRGDGDRISSEGQGERLAPGGCDEGRTRGVRGCSTGSRKYRPGRRMRPLRAPDGTAPERRADRHPKLAWVGLLQGRVAGLRHTDAKSSKTRDPNSFSPHPPFRKRSGRSSGAQNLQSGPGHAL